MIRSRDGFTVAEVLVALTLIVIALLALMGLALRSLQSSRKANDTVAGQLVAEQVLEQLAQQAESSSTAAVWAHTASTPFQNTVVTQGVPPQTTAFNVTLYATDVPASGASFVSGKKLKCLEAWVRWQDAPTGKGGYGLLQVRASRLVHQP